MTYGEVALALDAHGLALHNMASLPHISVAGAVRYRDARLGRRARQPRDGGRRAGGA